MTAIATIETASPATPNVSLREHVDARLIIDEFLVQNDGELTPEIEALLRDHEHATTEKVESIAWFARQEESRIAGIDQMIAQLTARKRAIVNRVTWLKSHYLFDQLTRLGLKAGDAIKGTLSTIRLQLNNPRLDGEVAPERVATLYIDPVAHAYVRRQPEEFSLDKKALLEALKNAHATIAVYEAGIRALADPSAKQKDREIAQHIVDTTTDEELFRAKHFLGKFPELSIVRDVSVRIQ